MTPQQPGYAGASARIDGDDVHDNEPTGPTAAAGSRAAGLSSAETGSARRLPTVSLELFPPRPGKAASATWGRIDRLLATGPDFVSVTYRPTFVTDPAGGIGDEGGPVGHRDEVGPCGQEPVNATPGGRGRLTRPRREQLQADGGQSPGTSGLGAAQARCAASCRGGRPGGLVVVHIVSIDPG